MKESEIRVLARRLERMDYYRLLRVAPTASGSEIRSAYHRGRRQFHPDANLSKGAEVREAIARIAARITEGYLVLRDAGKRAAYDRALEQGHLRLTGELEGSAKSEAAGRTPNGRRFFALALDESRRGEIDKAITHVKTALTFEPRNLHFREKLDQLKQRRG